MDLSARNTLFWIFFTFYVVALCLIGLLVILCSILAQERQENRQYVKAFFSIPMAKIQR